MKTQQKSPFILVVDDDIFLRDLYADRFQKDGFIAETAADGEEALEKILNRIPDVIFTGIMMPRLDGFTFMRKLQENDATRNIPVFISSHHGKPADAEEARTLGAKGFFVRYRVTPQEVVFKIRSYLEGKTVYLVAVDPNKYDAPELFEDTEGRRIKEAALELTSNPDKPGTFTARLRTFGK